MRSLVRPKNRDTDQPVSPASTRKMAEVGAQALGREVAAKVIVVGPPGCCGCVSKSVSSSSRRKT
jgi:hypothetical protein